MLGSAVDAPRIGAETLDDARADLRRLAGDYALNPDLTRILAELVILRDRLYVLLDLHAKRPADSRELHLLLGATCVLMGSISHDLAEPQAAMIQARTAGIFAELAGHRGLQVWVQCTKAMVASWWLKPEDVLVHASVPNAGGGIAGIRLAGLQARALAQLGNDDAAVAVLRRAETERDRLPQRDSLHELGEVFSFSLARQHYYHAATYAHLGRWDVVEREAETTIGLYDHPAATQTWPVTRTLAQVYLAQARLHTSGVDGAIEALRPVLALPADQRIPQTTQALDGLRKQLAGTRFAALPAARTLGESIHSFTASP
jgi:hypothetical protein